MHGRRVPPASQHSCHKQCRVSVGNGNRASNTDKHTCAHQTSNTQAGETAADTEVNDETDDVAQGDEDGGQSEIMVPQQ